MSAGSGVRASFANRPALPLHHFDLKLGDLLKDRLVLGFAVEVDEFGFEPLHVLKVACHHAPHGVDKSLPRRCHPDAADVAYRGPQTLPLTTTASCRSLICGGRP